jgi:solute:Na+ symporter, SSS family
VILAAQFTMVLDAILNAYAFMVAGLFVPTLGGFFWSRGSASGAFIGMLGGGALTLLLLTEVLVLPGPIQSIGLDAAVYGIICSAMLYIGGSLLMPDRKAAP